MMSYLRMKGYDIYYKDCNSFVSAMEIFPDNLVVFTCDNLHNALEFNPYNLWFWNDLLQKRKMNFTNDKKIITIMYKTIQKIKHFQFLLRTHVLRSLVLTPFNRLFQ